MQRNHKLSEKYNPKELGRACVNVAQFGIQPLKYLKLERVVEKITNYFNENRRELVVC